jgi:predicted nucleic acid-binding protein
VSGGVVSDPSALVALLLDAGPDPRCPTDPLSGAHLATPSLALLEAAKVIRRHELAGRVSSDQSAQAHADLLDLAIEPYELLASRVRDLRANLASYDASYVALAELIGATLVTLHRRIGQPPDVRRAVAMP